MVELNEKKIKILEAAEALFAKNGFSGTSVREIAKEAGVNVAMINYYFEGKDKLLIAIFHFRSDYLHARTSSLLKDASLSNWQKLDLLIEEYVQNLSRFKSLHQIMLREPGCDTQSEIREFIIERKMRHYQRLKSFIQEGQQAGDFKTDIDLLMLYTQLPGITKHMLFNEDFMKQLMQEEEGKAVTIEALQERTKTYLKQVFRQTLEKK